MSKAKGSQIKKVHGREILDSRGNPTVEVEVELACGIKGRAAVPSGASTGAHEAVELRDGEKDRYLGQGVQKAVANIDGVLAGAITGMDASRQNKIDKKLIKTDGTKNKGSLGANAILGISTAVAKAAAACSGMSLYRYLGGVSAVKMPIPMMNIVNGGAHSSNNVDIQEFMILPIGAPNFKEGLRWCVEVYHTLKKLLKEKGLSTAVGDEGGFAPDVDGAEAVLDLLLESIKEAGYEAGKEKDFMISLDAAASEWKDDSGQTGVYHLPKAGTSYTTESLIDYWESMVMKYPIFSIEDPLDEEDWDGFKTLTERIGDRVKLVGDDLFVTNTERLSKGIKEQCGNAILIKINQIGTLSETMEAIRIAKKHGFLSIVSHRSGETEDTTIADLAVGLNTGYIKTGAPCRGERTAKYNRLLRIEEELS